jgi:hypothetical protein
MWFAVCDHVLQPKGSHTLLPACGTVGAIHVSDVCTGESVLDMHASCLTVPCHDALNVFTIRQ